MLQEIAREWREMTPEQRRAFKQKVEAEEEARSRTVDWRELGLTEKDMEGIHDEEEPAAGKQEEGGEEDEPASPTTVLFTKFHLGLAQALASREAIHHGRRLHQNLRDDERMMRVGGCRSRSASAIRLLLQPPQPLPASRPRSALFPASSDISSDASCPSHSKGLTVGGWRRARGRRRGAGGQEDEEEEEGQGCQWGMKDGRSKCFERACWLCREWAVILTVILPCLPV